MSRRTVLTTASAALLGLASLAAANARKFSYTYESAVLPAGARELEVSTTWRDGRTSFYSALDERVELEYGITDRLLTAFYLNWNKTTRELVPGYLLTDSSFGGVSSEWKYKLADASADPVGLAGYAELGVDTGDVELELKLIADKWIGPVLLAWNGVVEPEAEAKPGEFETEDVSVENDLGLSWAPGPQWGLGAEVRHHAAFAGGALDEAALFAGPVIHYASGAFWLTATVLGQIPPLKLAEHERVNARLLMSLPW